MQLPQQVHTLFHHPQGMERIRKHPFLFHQQAGEGSCRDTEITFNILEDLVENKVDT